MKNMREYFIITVSMLFIFSHCAQQEKLHVLRGTYFGQKPPGMTPEIFAPGVITTEYHEHSSPAFSLDGTEVYWSVFINFYGPQVILTMQQEDGVWNQPEVAPFSGQYTDGNPCFFPDGKKLFFESRRPIHENEGARDDIDLWTVERTENGWGQPKHLGWEVNSERWERGPSVSDSGNLFFCSMRDGGLGYTDLYCSKFEDGKYSAPENLGSVINTEGYESWPFIAPDESYIIYESDTGDLYISFRKDDNAWSKPIDMSEKIQSKRSQDRFPKLSNEGKYFFFVSNRWLGHRYFDSPLNLRQIKEKAKNISNGMGNVFWVDAKIIEELKLQNIRQ